MKDKLVIRIRFRDSSLVIDGPAAWATLFGAIALVAIIIVWMGNRG